MHIIHIGLQLCTIVATPVAALCSTMRRYCNTTQDAFAQLQKVDQGGFGSLLLSVHRIYMDTGNDIVYIM